MNIVRADSTACGMVFASYKECPIEGNIDGSPLTKSPTLVRPKCLAVSRSALCGLSDFTMRHLTITWWPSLHVSHGSHLPYSSSGDNCAASSPLHDAAQVSESPEFSRSRLLQGEMIPALG